MQSGALCTKIVRLVPVRGFEILVSRETNKNDKRILETAWLHFYASSAPEFQRFSERNIDCKTSA